jgi:hypothetical protein
MGGISGTRHQAGDKVLFSKAQLDQRERGIDDDLVDLWWDIIVLAIYVVDNPCESDQLGSYAGKLRSSTWRGRMSKKASDLEFNSNASTIRFQALGSRIARQLG